MRKSIISFALLPFATIAYGQITEAEKTTPEALVNEQLAGYNARDIEQFLRPYSDSIALYAFPRKLLRKGKGAIRERYDKFFTEHPDLHCEVVKRMVMDNTVIDHEHIVLEKGEPLLKAIAIYTIENGFIAEVTFIYPEER